MKKGVVGLLIIVVLMVLIACSKGGSGVTVF